MPNRAGLRLARTQEGASGGQGRLRPRPPPVDPLSVYNLIELPHRPGRSGVDGRETRMRA